MFLRFIILFFYLLSTSLVFAFEAPIRLRAVVECNDCNPSEVETAQTMAKSKEQELKNQINSISNTKEISQETICSLNTTIYNEKCTGPNGENPMDRLQTEVNQLKLQLKARITEINSSNNFKLK